MHKPTDCNPPFSCQILLCEREGGRGGRGRERERERERERDRERAHPESAGPKLVTESPP